MPLGKVPGVITTFGSLMVIEWLCAVFAPCVSCAVISNVNVPDTEGVPDNAPVALFNVSPAGKAADVSV